MNDYGNAEVMYSYNGRPDSRMLWAEVAGTEEEVSRVCTSLLMSLRNTEERAALWINGVKFKPTKADLAEYEECVTGVRQREDELRKTPVVEEEEVEAIIEEMCDDSTPDNDVSFEDLEDMPELLPFLD